MKLLSSLDELTHIKACQHGELREYTGLFFWFLAQSITYNDPYKKFQRNNRSSGCYILGKAEKSAHLQSCRKDETESPVCMCYTQHPP